MEASGTSSLRTGGANGGMGTETRPGAPEQPTAERGEAAPQQVARRGLLLAVCCVAQFMVILDLSIVNVALPHIQDSLNISFAKLPWVIDTYAITFASFLMLAGRAADQLGHRKIFVAALGLFGVTSLIGGFSDV